MVLFLLLVAHTTQPEFDNLMTDACAPGYRNGSTPLSLHAAYAISVGPQVKMLVFDRAPKSFDENVIQRTAFGVHADFDFVSH